MIKRLNLNLTLVTSEESFEAFLDEVLPVGSSVMTDLNKLVRKNLSRPTGYPVLVTASPATGIVFTLVSEVIESLQ